MPKVIHKVGFPKELTDNQSKQPRSLSWPCVVIINETSEGYFLIRYDINGAFCGDTWHMSWEDAIGQARYEYGDLISDWINMPSNVEDPIQYALKNSGQSG